jgi:hypothetical protein
MNETTPKKSRTKKKKELQLSKDRACSNEDNRAASDHADGRAVGTPSR